MSEDQGGFDSYLEPGLIVSIQTESKLEVAAAVRSVVEDLISLELLAAGPEPTFREGERVRIRYWDLEVTAYHWGAEVGQMFPEKHLVTFSTQDAGIVQRRKSCRVETPIPFSLTVIQSAEPELAGQHVEGLETQNLSVNGVLFQTDLPLKEGDKAGLNLNLAQVLNAVGWVVRSKPVGAGVNAVALMFLLLEKEEQRQLIQLIGELA